MPDEQENVGREAIMELMTLFLSNFNRTLQAVKDLQGIVSNVSDTNSTLLDIVEHQHHEIEELKRQLEDRDVPQ